MIRANGCPQINVDVITIGDQKIYLQMFINKYCKSKKIQDQKLILSMDFHCMELELIVIYVCL